MAHIVNGITAHTRIPLECERKLHAMEALLLTFGHGGTQTPIRHALIERAEHRLTIIAEVMTGEPPHQPGWRGAIEAMREELDAAVGRWRADPSGLRLRELEIVAEQVEHATNVVRDLMREYAVYLDPALETRLCV